MTSSEAPWKASSAPRPNADESQNGSAPGPVSLTPDTRLDEFMRALLGSSAPTGGALDPQATDVESRLAQVLAEVGLLSVEPAPTIDTAPNTANSGAPSDEPPAAETRAIWRASSTAVTRVLTSEESARPGRPRGWIWRGTRPRDE